MSITIYHNPKCATSRKVLGFLREAGIEPKIIEYLKAPPSKTKLKDLLRQMSLEPRALIRKKERLYADLGLDAAGLSDAALIAAMVEHPDSDRAADRRDGQSRRALPAAGKGL